MTNKKARNPPPHRLRTSRRGGTDSDIRTSSESVSRISGGGEIGQFAIAETEYGCFTQLFVHVPIA